MKRIFFTVAAILVVTGCNESKSAPPAVSAGAGDFEKLTNDFIYGSLALSPAAATQAGYHQHNGVPLDEAIDDWSAAGLDAQRRFANDMQNRIAALNVNALDQEQQADVQIIRNNITLSM